jgi:hypothetical protein
MRALDVIVVPKGAEPHTRLGEGREDVQVQALVAHRPIEAFLLAILPWLARINIQRLDAALCQPCLHGDRHKLCSVVAAEVHWRAMLRDQRDQHADDPFR